MDLSDFYVSSCAECYVLFAITAKHEARLRTTHAQFYCPSGHPQSFKAPTEQEREIERLKARLADKDRELLALKKKKRSGK